MQAVPFMERALELDPNFALAHARLGTIFSNAFGPTSSEAQQYRARAFALRDRVSERERLYITAHYYASVLDDRDKAIAAYEQYRATYPRDTTPATNLAVIYNLEGQYERAIREGSAAIALEPDNAAAYRNLALSYQSLARLDEVDATREQAKARGISGLPELESEMLVAFMRGRQDVFDRVLAETKSAAYGMRTMNLAAQADAAKGQLRNSRQRRREAAALALGRNRREQAYFYLADAALTDVLVGNARSAREMLAAAEAIYDRKAVNDRGITPTLALALLGDVEEAERQMVEMEGKYRGAGVVRSTVLPVLRAAIEMQRRRPDRALAALEVARPYDLGALTGLPISYTRGSAFVASQRARDARAEFTRIVDHPGIDPVSIFHSLAQLGVARTAAMLGDTAASRSAYEAFFAMWKDADADIPVLVAARKEYERLK
jgi:tetratricopeptide (TPR) repeat protein